MDNYNDTDKPFKNYDEQLDILKKRGLIIGENLEDELQAKEYLKTKSYYILINSFKNAVTHIDDNSNEVFNKNITINELMVFFRFESDLKSVLLKYILLFEIYFKQTLSYEISKNYGVKTEKYLDYSIYKTSRHHPFSEVNYLRSCAGIAVDENYKIKNPCYMNNMIKRNPTDYYREMHDTIPPWILVQNLTLGQVQCWYKILPNNSKRVIVSHILNKQVENIAEVDFKAFADGIEIIRAFRNKLAHASKIFQFHAKRKQHYKDSNKNNQYRYIDIDFSYRFICNEIGANYISEEKFRRGVCKNDLFNLITILKIFLSNSDSIIFKFDLINVITGYLAIPEYERYIKDYFKFNELPLNLTTKLAQINDE